MSSIPDWIPPQYAEVCAEINKRVQIIKSPGFHLINTHELYLDWYLICTGSKTMCEQFANRLRFAMLKGAEIVAKNPSILKDTDGSAN